MQHNAQQRMSLLLVNGVSHIISLVVYLVEKERNVRYGDSNLQFPDDETLCDLNNFNLRVVAQLCTYVT
jgi:hypothetical protein